jgi:hypothetical protein
MLSLRSGFTAYFELSPVTGFLATVTSQDSSRETWRQHRAPSASHLAFVFASAASTASHRTFVTIASRPSSGETGGAIALICPTG